MIRKLLKKYLQNIGFTANDRFNDEWNSYAIIISLSHYTKMLFRGCLKRIWMGKSEGLVLVGKRVKIMFPKYLKTGENFIADDYCEINALSIRGIILGKKVTIGKNAIIKPTNYYGGKIGEGLKVGNNSNIGPFSYIGCSGYVEIGSNVMMSPRVSIYAENHNFNNVDVNMKEQGVTRQSVKIEDNCWIAANSVILAGVTIGCGSIVSAGSIVTKDVPPYSIVGGVPAKIIKMRKNV